MRKHKKPTRRDEIILYVIEYASDHQGNSPSLGEIALNFGIRRETVYIHTLKLANEGRAQWRDGKLCIIGAEFIPPLTDVI